MTIYLTMALILAAVMATVLWLPRKPAVAASERQAVAVYRNQLQELEQDVASGKIPKADADGLRAEIARRLLAADRDATVKPGGTSNAASSALFALIIPAIAIPVYLWQGAPQVNDVPLAARLDRAIENNDLEAMVAQTERRIAQNPKQAQGWSVLAPIYLQMGRPQDAAAAYAQLLNLEPPTADRYASLAEALIAAEDGMVSAEAASAIRKAVALDANHPKANFYFGVSLKQDGKSAEARRQFEGMLNAAPKDAPWRAAVEQQIATLANAPALTDEQMAAGRNMPASDQKVMIKGMVDGLEQKLADNADNIDGWLRLIRARTVLGETDKAKEALAKATEHFQSKPQELFSINALAIELKLQ